MKDYILSRPERNDFVLTILVSSTYSKNLAIHLFIAELHMIFGLSARGES
jgi:hypothetical protein